MRFLLFHTLILFPLVCAAQTRDSAETRAWRQFTQQIESAGIEILNSYPQPQQLDRTEALAYLLQQLSSSIDQQLIRQPGQIPLLRVGATTLKKWGLDGADAKYQGASLDSNGSYRFFGRLGSARLFAAQLNSFGATYKAYGSLTGDQLQADADGYFEVLIAAEKPDSWQGVWLEADPGAQNLLVREYFSDWATEQPGTYQLERLDSPPPAAPLTTQQVNALLSDTAKTFSTRAPQWRDRVEQTREHSVNTARIHQTDKQGLASNAIGSGWFSVKPDEALLIEMDAPDALLWSVQLGNVWWESLDYINHTASYNDSQAVAGSDGKYRFVLSQKDPGVANWLDPSGHLSGQFIFRMQKAKKVVQPEFTLISLSDLADHLPEDTPTVGEQMRREEITARRRHAARRWAP